MRAPVARPREVRGWLVYGSAIGAAFLMLAFRLYYGPGPGTSPFLLISWIDIPFLVALLAAALAAIGLHQALWYFLVKPGGWVLYGASLLMFVVASLFFYALPNHLVPAGGPPGPSPGPGPSTTSFLLMFVAALVLYLYVPALSYGSKMWTGIAVAGDAGLLAASAYGPMRGLGPMTNVLVLATLASEGVLLLALLRLLQLSFQKPTAAATPA